MSVNNDRITYYCESNIQRPISNVQLIPTKKAILSNFCLKFLFLADL